MKTLFKKSLRAKVTLILLLVGIVPLAATSAFFYYTAKDALFKNVFNDLKWSIDEVSLVIENYFNEAQKDLLIASRNTAFNMYFLDPENRRHWVNEQQRTLKYLRTIYPDMIDEACFIDSTGKEISRIVFDEISHEHDLSSGEDRSEFFQEAFKMNEGEVYQGRPVISEDTERWVLPNATPIMAGGRKAAILHFEVTLTYFQGLLKKLINPDRGYGFILDGEGKFIAHTRLEISESGPFPEALGRETPRDMAEIYGRMMRGESGVESFTEDGEEHYIIFKPISTSIQKGRNENSWSLGYAIPGERVYIELDILRYNAIALVLIAAAVTILSYVIGSYLTRPIRDLASATRKVTEGEMPVVPVRRDDELGTLSKSFNMMVESIKRRDEALKELAITDGLTGLFNYRFFKGEMERVVKSSQRFARPMSLVMADVDFFKHYNDNNGHAQGDLALKAVAEVLLKNLREVDIPVRYGGEEFAVILPETRLDEALMIAERIRRKLEEEIIPYEELQPNGSLTLSIGVAELWEGADVSDLVKAADKALYRAKALGRNRVCEAGEEDR